jgi:hypothetical protein
MGNLTVASTADNRGEPTQLSRAPVGFSLVTDVLAEKEGLQAKLGGLEVLYGILPGPGQVSDRLVLGPWDINWGQITGAHYADQCCGIAPVGFYPVTRLLWDEGGSDDPAGVALFGEVAVEPVAAGAGLVDEHELAAAGGKAPEQLVYVALPGADGAEGHHIGIPVFGGISDSDRVLMNIETYEESCGRLGHG